MTNEEMLRHDNQIGLQLHFTASFRLMLIVANFCLGGLIFCPHQSVPSDVSVLPTSFSVNTEAGEATCCVTFLIWNENIQLLQFHSCFWPYSWHFSVQCCLLEIAVMSFLFATAKIRITFFYFINIRIRITFIAKDFFT